ncbi:MAG TPA: aminoglycoside phosphotransferase family protein [Polyangiaceae bacterium]|nr:aminoglycoside phosphotransferase family protein [Polyangiaceae bacterium]
MNSADEPLRAWVRGLTSATSITAERTIQALWGGYGRLVRFELAGGSHASLVVKIVRPPAVPHARDEAVGHARKLRSYEVEEAFYSRFSASCPAECRVPRAVGARHHEGARWLALEDLGAVGARGAQAELVLGWLAWFHARFLGAAPSGLWARGSYWHLGTRRAELLRTRDPRIVRAAPDWDRRLASVRHGTWIHGDAKLDNFCLAPDGRIAAVDFQYVGPGPGVVDVAYFLSSALSDSACATEAPRLLDAYFGRLRGALTQLGRPELANPVEAEWRELYPVAWADLFRFYSGWAPSLAESETYARAFAERLLADDTADVTAKNTPEDTAVPDPDDGSRFSH